MLKLLKMDFNLLLTDKYTLIRGMIYAIALFAFAIELDFADIAIMYIPIFIVLPNSSIPNIKEDIVRNYSMIQSLPVKRWEYVISRYIVALIKHFIFIIYLVLVLKLLDFLGISSLDYIRIIYSKETMVMWLLTYLAIIPVMFMVLGGFGQTFLSFLLTNFIKWEFENEVGGRFSLLAQNLDKVESIYTILLMIVVSMGISIFIYSKRDLK